MSLVKSRPVVANGGSRRSHCAPDRQAAQGCIRQATWRRKPRRTAADGCARNCASEKSASKVRALGRAPVRPSPHCPRRRGLFMRRPRLLLCPARAPGRPLMRFAGRGLRAQSGQVLGLTSAARSHADPGAGGVPGSDRGPVPLEAVAPPVSSAMAIVHLCRGAVYPKADSRRNGRHGSRRHPEPG